ncbi:MAG: 1-(5-phosphoribosyl)-5-[(5-phosphoribosylamino)methylideneamino]imidazole-4-carboxamide isomerase [Oscillospiraceae bacterium]|nr:1-(5-phosphoribosyl)-5-[(5-phosphoribosylamino)methylideneamino]imidazole-4-carboxamide isomerase [Oscillospiraceae bacterium]
MIILPAIDLHNGQCVRLQRGDYATAHKVADNAVETAQRFIDAGASMIHVVDLDAAKGDVSVNGDVIAALCKLSVKIELGGGLRDMVCLERADKLGITRMIIGSAAVRNPEFVSQAVAKYGDRIAIGIDALNDDVKTDGWLQNSGVTSLDMAIDMEKRGVCTLIVTDIDKDGMLEGPNFALYRTLREKLSCAIVASGGMSNHEDLRRLHDMGVDAAIVGKAAYSGGIDVARAVRELE